MPVSIASTANDPLASVIDLDGLVETVRSNWELWLWAGGMLLVAIVIGLVIHTIVFAVLVRVAKRTDWRVDDLFFRKVKRPSRLIFPLLAVQVVLPSLQGLTASQLGLVRHIVSLATIAAVGWLAIAIVRGFEATVRGRYDVSVADNLEARRVHTQISVLARTLVVFIVILTIAAVLMTFPRIRELGASLLVSAGFAGLAIGLAARPVLENLIAGMQIAMTQPIRLDDVVIIDGEWGRIEEITTTYVVVKIWDERRLIVPFSKFIADSFQNWTRTSADILGTVKLYLDYTVPIERVREQLQEIVEASDLWDGRVCNLQVTDLSERTVTLRALVSTADASKGWNLRVHVREKLLEFLQREYPESLPRSRVDVVTPVEANWPEPATAGRDDR